MSDINPDELDPGIRDLVMWMRNLGIPTTDSGDGVSKPRDPEVLDVPHVFAVYEAAKYGSAVDAFGMATIDACHLNQRLPQRDDTAIEVTWSPRDNDCILAVMGYMNGDVPRGQP